MANPTSKPRVALGLMTFGPEGTEGTRVSSNEDFAHILDTFSSAGYTELDTARTYNNREQEAWTTRALASSSLQHKFKIATKLWPESPGDHAEDKIREAVGESLKALDTDCLDIWYLHAPDRAVPFETTLAAVNRLYEEGKIKTFGLSNYAAWEVAQIVTICESKGWVKPTIYQAMYNCLARTIEEELVPCCRKFGLNLMVYNVLAGGVLSGRYQSKAPPQDGGRYSGSSPAYTKVYLARFWKDVNFEALKLIQPVLERHGLTLIETAYRWCIWHSKLRFQLSGGGNDGMIIGASSLEQLQNNLKALDGGKLPEEVVQVLDLAWSVTKADCASYRIKEYYDTR